MVNYMQYLLNNFVTATLIHFLYIFYSCVLRIIDVILNHTLCIYLCTIFLSNDLYNKLSVQ